MGERTSLKRAKANHPLGSSKDIFLEAGVTMTSKAARCRVLKRIGKPVKAVAKSALTASHKQQRFQWARENLETHFANVIWTDECRVTLEGPDGWVRSGGDEVHERGVN